MKRNRSSIRLALVAIAASVSLALAGCAQGTLANPSTSDREAGFRKDSQLCITNSTNLPISLMFFQWTFDRDAKDWYKQPQKFWREKSNYVLGNGVGDTGILKPNMSYCRAASNTDWNEPNQDVVAQVTFPNGDTTDFSVVNYETSSPYFKPHYIIWSTASETYLPGDGETIGCDLLGYTFDVTYRDTSVKEWQVRFTGETDITKPWSDRICGGI